MINQFMVSGNLTRDPEVKTAGNSEYVLLGIANNRRWPKRDNSNNIIDGEYNEEVSYFDVKVWKKALVTKIPHDLSQGDGVVVTGRIDHERWEDRDTGDKRSKHLIVVSNPNQDVVRTQRFSSYEEINGGSNSGGGNSNRGNSGNQSNPLDSGSQGGPDW